jgi:hypothetical protein
MIAPQRDHHDLISTTIHQNFRLIMIVSLDSFLPDEIDCLIKDCGILADAFELGINFLVVVKANTGKCAIIMGSIFIRVWVFLAVIQPNFHLVWLSYLVVSHAQGPTVFVD